MLFPESTIVDDTRSGRNRKLLYGISMKMDGERDGLIPLAIPPSGLVQLFGGLKIMIPFR
jgi:hypothetical protein